MRTKPLNPNSMAMIMENFRRYAEQTEDYGPLYLFEDGVSKEVSFYDHIHQLNESDEAAEVFLENWENSADYFLAQLNEAEPAQQSQWQLLKQNPALFLSTQAWVNLGRFKDKAAGAVTRVLSKIGGALQPLKAKSPKLYKFGVESLKGLAWMTAGILVYKIIQSGGNAEGLDQVAAAVENVAPDASQAIENISQAGGAEQGIEALQTFDAEARQAIEALPGLGDQVGAPDGSALDGASEAITQAVETYPDPPPQEDAIDWFAQAMEEKTREGEGLGGDEIDYDELLRQAKHRVLQPGGGEGGAGPEGTTGFNVLGQQMKQTLKPEQIDDLINQLEAGDLKRSGRKALRQLYRADLEPAAKFELNPVVAWTKKGHVMPGLPVWIDDLRKAVSG